MHVMASTRYIRREDDDECFVLDRHTQSDSQLQLIETSQREDNSHHWDIFYYRDSEPTIICYYSLMLHYKRKNRKYQLHSLWFNPTASRTHQSNRTRGYNHAVYDEYIVKSSQTHCYFILKVYFTTVISLILYKKKISFIIHSLANQRSNLFMNKRMFLYVGFPFFYACSFLCAPSGSFVPYMDRQKLVF